MARKLPEDILAWLRKMATGHKGEEWGPDPVICMWCSCWLYSLNHNYEVSEVHDGAHKADCLAVKYLGASTVPRKVPCTCRRRDTYGAHEKRCAIYKWKEPYL